MRRCVVGCGQGEEASLWVPVVVKEVWYLWVEGNFLKRMLGMETILNSFVLLKLTVGDAAQGILTGPAAEVAPELVVLGCVFL